VSVTAADRARGWLNVELELGGLLMCSRLHALTDAELLSLASLDPANTLIFALAKSLRIEKEAAARIPPDQQLRLMMLLTSLTDVAAEKEMKVFDPLNQIIAMS